MTTSLSIVMRHNYELNSTKEQEVSIKKLIVAVLIAALITSVLLVGCSEVAVTGSGNLKTETLNFTDFTKVEAESGFQVELTKSSTFSVEITADDNVLEDIEVDKSSDTLRGRPLDDNRGLEKGINSRSWAR